ncbi:Gustatory receptor 122 [Halyomorpha halys]|nr:Gustatory receptor 122 [Halyomorpha halys]
MKWCIECSSLEEACKKIFQISRMVAMFPLSDECQFSPKFLIVPAIVCCMLSINSTYWIATGQPYLNLDKSFFHRYIHNFRKLTMTFSYTLFVCQLVLEREKLRHLLNNLRIINTQLAFLNKRPISALSATKYLFNISLSIFVLIIQVLSDHAVFWMRGLIETILLAVYINQMLAFCDLFKHCLEQISVFPRLTRNKRFTQRTRIYNVIEECSQNIDDVYGIGMFFIITSFFVTILHQFFQYLNRTVVTAPEITGVFLTAACNLWLILQLIIACSGVAAKAKMFNKTLYNELMNDGCKNVPNHKEIYFHFERASEFRFTASGFFSVDQNLICSMIITGTTYLVILMQYSDK